MASVTYKGVTYSISHRDCAWSKGSISGNVYHSPSNNAEQNNNTSSEQPSNQSEEG